MRPCPPTSKTCWWPLLLEPSISAIPSHLGFLDLPPISALVGRCHTSGALTPSNGTGKSPACVVECLRLHRTRRYHVAIAASTTIRDATPTPIAARVPVLSPWIEAEAGDIVGLAATTVEVRVTPSEAAFRVEEAIADPLVDAVIHVWRERDELLVIELMDDVVGVVVSAVTRGTSATDAVGTESTIVCDDSDVNRDVASASTGPRISIKSCGAGAAKVSLLGTSQ